jgi:hypothetical protein
MDEGDHVQGMDNVVLKLLLNDFPGLLFFSTYTLLVLFWAEIYQQARSQATARLRPTFLYANVSVYTFQIGLLILCGFKPAHVAASVRDHLHPVPVLVSVAFLVSFARSACCVLYGVCHHGGEREGHCRQHNLGSHSV